ncbi:MAG: hypothetical protein RSC93_02085 [Erysipelotrichaceae bacterium]
MNDFEKIVLLKQSNHSISDRLTNINIRSAIIGRVFNERTKLVDEDELIVLDDYYKCTWYGYYKVFTFNELGNMYESLLKEYISLSNEMKTNGKKILKLRGNKWSI